MDDDALFASAPYSMERAEKEAFLSSRLDELTKRHYDACAPYRRIIDVIGSGTDVASRSSCPFIPVRLFKDIELKSVPDDEVFKVMTSSGTTGQRVSKIYLDRETSLAQQRALVRIVSDFTGAERMPMIIIDSPSVIKDRTMYSARGAGIMGFSIFSARRCWALDEEMKLDIDGVREFIDRHAGQTMLLFGFTYMIWLHLCRALDEAGERLEIPDGVLIHGGGWKKLEGEAVGRDRFKAELERLCGIKRVHDYYGMVEQMGCIYMECEEGHLHASILSDVITRRTSDLTPCEMGEEGVMQVISALPRSYPGHSILTEDKGIILGEDDCPCGRLGRYFALTGRMKDAEVRGCSDTYERR